MHGERRASLAGYRGSRRLALLVPASQWS